MTIPHFGHMLPKLRHRVIEVIGAKVAVHPVIALLS